MMNEDIKAEMEKYTEALEKEKYDALKKITESDEDTFERREFFFKPAREKVHSIAMGCLDKILTPELKVFVQNLSLDRLGFPDDPLFYKIFGNYPQVGDKVSEEEIKAQGIDLWKFEDARSMWDYEGSCFVWDKEINGKKYWVIEDLNELDEEQIEAKREWLKKSSQLKRSLAKITQLDSSIKEEIFDLLEKTVPLIGKMGI